MQDDMTPPLSTEFRLWFQRYYRRRFCSRTDMQIYAGWVAGHSDGFRKGLKEGAEMWRPKPMSNSDKASVEGLPS